MATTKKIAPVRLTEEGLAIMRAAAARLGLTQAGAVEVILRDYAQRNSIDPATAPPRQERHPAGVEK